MPKASNGDINIYYEVEGEGPPLVLAHGGTADSSLWGRYRYTNALKSDFQLVLFDARGHGKSDKPHDHASYEQSIMVEDVIAVLDDMGLSKAHYLGFSLGALIGYILAAKHAERFLSFTLMEMNPLRFPESNIQSIKMAIEGYKALAIDPEAALKEFEKHFKRSFTPNEKKSFLARDGVALVASMESQLDWPKLSENDLSQITLPCLIMCGELDPWATGSEDVASSIPNSRFVYLPGLNHGQVWESND